MRTEDYKGRTLRIYDRDGGDEEFISGPARFMIQWEEGPLKIEARGLMATSDLSGLLLSCKMDIDTRDGKEVK